MSVSKRTMYNEGQKIAYIRQATQSINTAEFCELLFKAFAPFEEAWGADLCTRTAEELQPVVEKLCGPRSTSEYRRLVVLRSYVNWCIANKIPGAIDGVSELNALGLKKIRETSVKSPAHLQRCLNQVFDPEDEHTVDNTYRCYYWLAYGGMPEEEILSVISSEVDFQNLEVRHAGFTIPIYREALRAFRNCAELDHFVYQNPGYVNKKDIIRFRAEGDVLLRGIRAVPAIMSMRTELSRRTKKVFDAGKTNVRLSYNRVRLSGFFYRQLENEEQGLPLEFESVAALYNNGEEYNLERTNKTQAGKRREIARDLQRDYERWKAAYSIFLNE